MKTRPTRQPSLSLDAQGYAPWVSSDPRRSLLTRDVVERDGECFRTVDPEAVLWRLAPLAASEDGECGLSLDELRREASRRPNPSRLGRDQIVSTDHRDLRGDIIRTEGIEIEDYLSNPLVLLLHGKDQTLPVVGGNAALEYTEVQGLPALACREWLFGDTELGRDVGSLWNDGILRAASIAVQPIEWVPMDAEGNYLDLSNPRLEELIAGVDILRSRMVEWSIVLRGADPKALRRMWLDANRQTYLDMAEAYGKAERAATERYVHATRPVAEFATPVSIEAAGAATAVLTERAGDDLAAIRRTPGELVERAEQRLYERVSDFIVSTPWAIHPEMLDTIVAIIAERRSGFRPSEAEIRERIGATPRAEESDAVDDIATTRKAVHSIAIHGPIIPRASLLAQSSGVQSADGLRREITEAAADDDVRAIVLDINSPGGSVALVPELGAAIRRARESKPIVAVANTQAASAAYWIAAQAGEIAVSPSAEVGSIGVYSAHQDQSEAMKKAGRKVTLVKAGRYKVEGNPFEPLSPEAKAEIQRGVDAYYAMFVRAVAAGRDVSEARVRSDFGQGRMLMAEEAVAAGMADRVATLDEVVEALEAEFGAGRSESDAGEEERETVLDEAAAAVSSWAAASDEEILSALEEARPEAIAPPATEEQPAPSEARRALRDPDVRAALDRLCRAAGA